MKTHFLTTWACAGLAALGTANAATLLNADFESNPIGRTPPPTLPGTPLGDLFITADTVPVVSFSTVAGSRHAVKLQPAPGRTEVKAEFRSAMLPAGPRNTVMATGIGKWQGDGKKDDLVVTVSMDGSRVLGILEFRDRQLQFGEVGTAGRVVRTHWVANCPMESVHQWSLQFDPAAGKCEVKFRDASGRLLGAKRVACPNAPYLGNARSLALTYQYFDAEPGHRSYLVDRVNAFVNSP